MTKWPFPLFCLGGYYWNGDTWQLGLVFSFLCFYSVYFFFSVCFLSLIKKAMTLLLKVGGILGRSVVETANWPQYPILLFFFSSINFSSFSWSSVCPAGIYPSDLLCSLTRHLTVSCFLEEVICATLRLCPSDGNIQVGVLSLLQHQACDKDNALVISASMQARK